MFIGYSINVLFNSIPWNTFFETLGCQLKSFCCPCNLTMTHLSIQRGRGEEANNQSLSYILYMWDFIHVCMCVYITRIFIRVQNLILVILS